MTIELPAVRNAGVWRRFWPEFILFVGIGLAVTAIGLSSYLSSRILLLGSVDASKIAIFLAVTSVWCLAAFVVGRVAMVFSGGGTSAEVLVLLFSAVVLIGTIAVSAIAGLAASLTTVKEPYYRLDTPGPSTDFLVATFTFGETRLTLYRRNGMAFERTNVRAPLASGSATFATSHRVETDAQGRSFLIYPQQSGGEARVPLPTG